MISSFLTSLRDAWSILVSNDSFVMLLNIFALLFYVFSILYLIFVARYK